MNTVNEAQPEETDTRQEVEITMDTRLEDLIAEAHDSKDVFTVRWLSMLCRQSDDYQTVGDLKPLAEPIPGSENWPHIAYPHYYVGPQIMALDIRNFGPKSCLALLALLDKAGR